MQHDQPRKLIKRNPPSSDRNPNSLRRAASASLRSRSNSSAQQSIQHTRSPTLPSPGTSSRASSIDATLAQNLTGASYNAQLPYTADKGPQNLDFGQFDSASIVSRINNISYPSEPQLAKPQAPPPLLQQHSDLTAAQSSQLRYQNPNQSSVTLANPDVRLSESLAATGRRMDDISAPRGDLSAKSPRQRLSDEAKETKGIKKKTGFSSFVNNLVGTPKRPAISAPENPVHVTHVGYDQETGEFTVSELVLDSDCRSQEMHIHPLWCGHAMAIILTAACIGVTERMATNARAQWHYAARPAEESSNYYGSRHIL